MSSVSGISSISASASAALASATADTASQPTITSLQSQLLLYSKFATGSGPSAIAYKDLLIAVNTGNIPDAQEALVRLQRDSLSAGPAASATTPASPPVENGGDNGGGIGGSINTTA